MRKRPRNEWFGIGANPYTQWQELTNQVSIHKFISGCLLGRRQTASQEILDLPIGGSSPPAPVLTWEPASVDNPAWMGGFHMVNRAFDHLYNTDPVGSIIQTNDAMLKEGKCLKG